MLASILPKFVADEISSDIAADTVDDKLPPQFHKIYIHRYDNVR
jgi:hypothetical protein